ncbi:hypothetical protein [Synechococcus elongatus]|uniref:Uncharacterized protein n=2 Tax=Synechococcus elongatus TaxID=32046 RepID=A0AAN1QM14_SYNEL|nr:hypothetical protein [Synechococcus elongatus]AZB71756.1 hypothetical protein DOP62_02580 [Synechococcus elongatus PCC 11801]QFZ91437.1 hypothetical protein EKO22_02675 [Synechococcus elongatus PCC 11802]
MARYTCSTTVEIPLGLLYPVLHETLEACNLSILHDSADYLVAREPAGKVPFSQLVVTEVLVNTSMAQGDRISLQFICKNEELPLKSNNHCQQVFRRLSDRLQQTDEWKLVDFVAA